MSKKNSRKSDNSGFPLKRVKFTWLLLFGLFASTANAAKFITKEKATAVETYINQARQQLDIPGVAVGILVAGEPVLLKGYGVRNRLGDPMTVNTSVELGSLSKSFTALAIMQLAKEQRLDIDRPVVDYIPWFQSHDKSLSDKISVRHLLNHRSGFSTADGNRNLASQDNSINALKTAVSELSVLKLAFQPGENFQYSNINYQILAYLLEQIEGKSFEQIIEQNIFKKLSMKSSFAINQPSSEIEVAEGFQFSFGSTIIAEVEQGRVTMAQGRLKASATDMLSYIAQFMPDNKQFIPQSIQEELFAIPEKEAIRGYAMGWQVSQKENYRIIYHFGRSFGFESVVLFSPELEFGMVALVNANSSFGTHNIGAFLNGIGDIILGEQPHKPDSPLFEKILFWSVFLIPGIIIIAAFNFIRKYHRGQLSMMTQPFNFSSILMRILLPSITLVGLVYSLLVLLPAEHYVTLKVVAMAEPALYSGLIISSSISLLWFTVRTLLILQIIKNHFRTKDNAKHSAGYAHETV